MHRPAKPALFGANGESDGISIYFGASVVAVIGVAMFRTRMARPIARIALAAVILNAVVALVVMIAALPFFTSTRWSPADGVFGALPFIWGTLFTAVIALAIAVPISLGVALFITHVAQESSVQATLADLASLDAVRNIGGLLRVIGDER